MGIFQNFQIVENFPDGKMRSAIPDDYHDERNIARFPERMLFIRGA